MVSPGQGYKLVSKRLQKIGRMAAFEMEDPLIETVGENLEEISITRQEFVIKLRPALWRESFAPSDEIAGPSK